MWLPSGFWKATRLESALASVRARCACSPRGRRSLPAAARLCRARRLPVAEAPKVPRVAVRLARRLLAEVAEAALMVSGQAATRKVADSAVEWIVFSVGGLTATPDRKSTR